MTDFNSFDPKICLSDMENSELKIWLNLHTIRRLLIGGNSLLLYLRRAPGMSGNLRNWEMPEMFSAE